MRSLCYVEKNGKETEAVIMTASCSFRPLKTNAVMSKHRSSSEMQREIETFMHILVHQPTFGQMYFNFAVYIYIYIYVDIYM